MSYYSAKKYAPKLNSEELWFEELYFNRWFKGFSGPILDIGCATGNFIFLAPEIIEGIDIDEDALEIARNRGFRVNKIDVEKEMNLLVGEKYEGVWAKQIIEHLNDPLNFLKEIRRILKVGGKAILYTPNCPYMLNKSFWDDYTHKRPFTKAALYMIAYDAGFRKIKIYEDFRCFPGVGRLMRLFHILPATVTKIQRIFFIRGLSLILSVEK